ncbi:MAG: hypothetical protein IKB45_05180 [Clostridia bacterium]|nr:hypothetical protein [Clostridia bacterium]
MKLTKKLLAVLLSLLVVFSLCACGADTSSSKDDVSSSEIVSGSDDTSSEEKTSKFEVKVVDANGNPVEGVMLQICKDSCIPAKTDANGVATFNIEVTSEHKLSVLSCPAGYEYTGEAEVYMEDGATEYTVELSEAA